MAAFSKAVFFLSLYKIGLELEQCLRCAELTEVFEGSNIFISVQIHAGCVPKLLLQEVRLFYFQNVI